MKFCFTRTLKHKATWLWAGRLISSSGTKRLLFSKASVQVLGLIHPRFKWVEASWNVMAHAQKPDLVFRRNGWVPLNRRGRQFIGLLAAEVCASAVVMLDTPCSEVVWRVLATHSFRQFPLHFPSRALPCTITLQLESTRNSFFWGLQPARGTDHSPQCGAKIKNKWDQYLSSHHIPVWSAKRQFFTLCLNPKRSFGGYSLL